MGNALDSRSQFQGGYIYVKTDKPFYYPGSKVYGKIYIRTEVALDASFLEIKVKGKEKASFVRTETYQDGDQSRTRHIKEKLHRKILEFKGTCFTFQQPYLNPGDYTIPFEFDLPAHLPASIAYHNRGHHAKPKAFLKYTVLATIHTHQHKKMKYK